MTSDVRLPCQECVLTWKVDGIYGLPDEWKTTDDANPNLFTYSAKAFCFDFDRGKVCGRESEREQEEKAKKGGKKDGKKEEPSAEEERSRKQAEEEQRRRQEELGKLSEEERHYRLSEDPFESSHLRFDNPARETKLTGQELLRWEERVGYDRGEWIYIYRTVAVAEEEVAKMRKAKPKTLQHINELNPIVMRAWLDLTRLGSEVGCSVVVRGRMRQVERTPETMEPNLEKTYVKVSLMMGSAVLEPIDAVRGKHLIPDPAPEKEMGLEEQAVEELNAEVKLALESLAMEYASMFWKELNLLEEIKVMQVFSSRKQEVVKRKEQFLYDFNVSGKYKVLKDRLKKAIVHLCQHKYSGAMGLGKSFTGVSCTIRDQFYSEIYSFLVDSYKGTFSNVLRDQMENLHEVNVLSPSAQAALLQKYLSLYKEESASERIQRVVYEYEVLFDYGYGEEVYERHLHQHPNDYSVKYSYAMYCLKHSLKTPEEVLASNYVEQWLSRNKNDEETLLQYTLLLISAEASFLKIWVLVREMIERQPKEGKYLLLAAFVAEHIGKNPLLALRLVSEAELLTRRLNGMIPERGEYKESPLPPLKPIEQEMDALWLEVIEIFQQGYLPRTASLFIGKITAKDHPKVREIRLTTLLDEGKRQEFIAESINFLQKDTNELLYERLIEVLFEEKDERLETVVKQGLSGGEKKKCLLRLGDYYVKREQWGNAVACLSRYLEGGEVCSGLSLRMLGTVYATEGHARCRGAIMRTQINTEGMQTSVTHNTRTLGSPLHCSTPKPNS